MLLYLLCCAAFWRNKE